MFGFDVHNNNVHTHFLLCKKKKFFSFIKFIHIIVYQITNINFNVNSYKNLNYIKGNKNI